MSEPQGARPQKSPQWCGETYPAGWFSRGDRRGQCLLVDGETQGVIQDVVTGGHAGSQGSLWSCRKMKDTGC